MPDKQSRTDRAEATFKRRESDTGGEEHRGNKPFAIRLRG